MLKAMNEASNVALAKMKEEANKDLDGGLVGHGSVGKVVVHDVS
jgi:hypothetical protein